MRRTMAGSFPRLTTRLSFVHLCSDQLRNMRIWLSLGVFEDHVFGVLSQYDRIVANSPSGRRGAPSIPFLTQLRLDIYYYTLTWDKLRKLFNGVKRDISGIAALQSEEFCRDFRLAKTQMEHLLGQLRQSVRNEFEHPSLEPNRVTNMLEWGSLVADHRGNLVLHAGGHEFAVVQKEHVERLLTVWVDLTDLFVRHFTDKRPSSALLQLRRHIEENAGKIIGTYARLRMDGMNAEASQLLNEIVMCDVHLAREGLPIRPRVRERLHSALLHRRLD